MNYIENENFNFTKEIHRLIDIAESSHEKKINFKRQLFKLMRDFILFSAIYLSIISFFVFFILPTQSLMITLLFFLLFLSIVTVHSKITYNEYKRIRSELYAELISSKELMETIFILRKAIRLDYNNRMYISVIDARLGRLQFH